VKTQDERAEENEIHFFFLLFIYCQQLLYFVSWIKR